MAAAMMPTDAATNAPITFRHREEFSEDLPGMTLLTPPVYFSVTSTTGQDHERLKTLGWRPEGDSDFDEPDLGQTQGLDSEEPSLRLESGRSDRRYSRIIRRENPVPPLER